MKKTGLLFLFILANWLIGWSQTPTIESLRKDYYKLNTDSVACKKVYTQLRNYDGNNNLILGYKGAVYAAMANHKSAKIEKMKLFNEGKKMLEQSISNDNNNLELRFLRFTIQTNCPKALGYYKEINTDKEYLLVNLNGLNSSDYTTKIADFLMNSTYLTAAEKQKIKK